MVIHGKDIIILSGGTAIASARSCEIQVQTDLIEVGSPSDGTAHHFIPGRYTWQLTTSHLLAMSGSTPLRTFIRQAIVSNTVTIIIKDNDYTNDQLMGTAICYMARVTATKGNLAQGAYTFQGSGPLT